MKEKIAGRISRMAKKATYNSLGKSFDIGVYEVKPPEELQKWEKEKDNWFTKRNR